MLGLAVCTLSLVVVSGDGSSVAPRAGFAAVAAPVGHGLSWALGSWALVVAAPGAQKLWCVDLVVPRHARDLRSQTRGATLVPYI